MKTATMWAVETEGDVEVICAIQRDAFAAGAEKMRAMYMIKQLVDDLPLPPFPEEP